VNDCGVQATAKNPDNIEKQTKTTTVAAVAGYFFSKWK